ncbi:MAG: hypothetical protein RDU76_06535 [Candidatus Edwardsbacteria bacterium]|nr:hypothetical protein [Candidatus Edwardsbacteria bacterium]
MKPKKYLLVFGLAALSCTAYIDPPRPSARMNERTVDIALHYPLQIISQVSSLAADRSGNACYTQAAGWVLASAGWDGTELFRSDLSQPRDVLIAGGADCYWLMNNLDRKIKCFDREGQQLSEAGFSGISATTGAATISGDIYLLDGSNAQVKVVDRSGYDLRSFHIELSGGGVFRPGSISVDASRNIMALADSRSGIIIFYNLYGARHSTLQITVGNHPQAVGFDYLGRLWVCQPEQGMVGVYVYEGEQWVKQLGVPFRRPYAVALSPFGRGIVAEDGSLTFVKF